MKAPTKKKRRRFKLLPWLIVAVIGAAIVAALPIWTIKEVVVNGAKMLSPEEIGALAGIPLGENLFYTSFAKARANLGRIPAIKSCRFYRIPPATVLISLEERQPIAFVIFPQYSAIIDRDGIVLNRNRSLTLNIPDSVDLPVVSGISQQKFLQGEKLDPSATEVILGILNKLNPYLGKKKLQIELGELANISILLDDILRVKLGKAEEIWRKMEVFGGLLPEVKDKWAQVEYLDIRYPDDPVIKFK